MIGVTECKTIVEKLALVIDDQMQLEAEEPAHRGFATSGWCSKDWVLKDTWVLAVSKRDGVDEADVHAATKRGIQISH
jgi:hypothetical protein